MPSKSRPRFTFIYVNNFLKTKIFSGKSLMIGGSNEIERNSKISSDLSSILIDNLPIWTQLVKIPKKKLHYYLIGRKRLKKLFQKLFIRC